jgi:hypothetical protein
LILEKLCAVDNRLLHINLGSQNWIRIETMNTSRKCVYFKVYRKQFTAMRIRAGHVAVVPPGG